MQRKEKIYFQKFQKNYFQVLCSLPLAYKNLFLLLEKRHVDIIYDF